MKHLAIVAAVAASLGSAALACSCLDTDDPAQLRTLAREIGPNAVALVEAEALTSYSQTPDGERMRVVRTLAGQAAAEFKVWRGRGFPSGASCDVLYEPGTRATIILYAAPQPATDGTTHYRTSGLCTDHLLAKPVFREEVARRISGAKGGERG